MLTTDDRQTDRGGPQILQAHLRVFGSGDPIKIKLILQKFDLK